MERGEWGCALSTCSRASVPSVRHRRPGTSADTRGPSPGSAAHPLVPAVIGRVAICVLPVERHAPSNGAAVLSQCWTVVELYGCPPLLMAAFSAGRPKECKTNRVNKFEALHPSEARRASVGLYDIPVPDVQVARRVVVHRQHVVPRPARARRGPSCVHRPSSAQRACQRSCGVGGRLVAFDPGSAVAGLGRVAGLGGVGGIGHGVGLRSSPEAGRAPAVGEG